MTDLPYTDADLRAEAIRQHANLTEDPDYVGVGEGMWDEVVPSTDGALGGSNWGQLLDQQADDNAAFGEAHRRIYGLITGAANTSAWAVHLGADGLTPDGHHADFGHHADKPVPLMRIHFAFHPEADETDRHALAQLATEAVQDALNHALNN